MKPPETDGLAQQSALTWAWPQFKEAMGRTIAEIHLLQDKPVPRCHRSEVIKIVFTDGSEFYIEAHTNAGNVARAHGDFDPAEFDVSLFTMFFSAEDLARLAKHEKRKAKT